MYVRQITAKRPHNGYFITSVESETGLFQRLLASILLICSKTVACLAIFCRIVILKVNFDWSKTNALTAMFLISACPANQINRLVEKIRVVWWFNNQTSSKEAVNRLMLVQLKKFFILRDKKNDNWKMINYSMPNY